MPVRFKLLQLECVFSTDKDGYSLAHFFTKTEELSPTFLLIRSTLGRVFGAFLSFPWFVLWCPSCGVQPHC